MTLDEKSKERMALAIALSRSKAVPDEYRGKPDEIFAVMEFGYELHVPPMLALNNIHDINGKPSMSTDLMLGLCMSHPDWGGYEVKESTDKSCTVVMYRYVRGNRMTYKTTFTLADAVTAKIYLSGGSWDKYRPRMLKMRATAFCARDAFPDILQGVHSFEELAPEEAAQEYARSIDAEVIVKANKALDKKPKRVDVSAKKVTPKKVTPKKPEPKPEPKVITRNVTPKARGMIKQKR
jgi:hypothetical protein